MLDDLHGLYLETMLPLLVLVSGLLNQDHYIQLASTLWRCLTDATTEIIPAVRHVVASADTCLLTVTKATFLVMQCAEKASVHIVRAAENDLSQYAFFFSLRCVY